MHPTSGNHHIKPLPRSVEEGTTGLQRGHRTSAHILLEDWPILSSIYLGVESLAQFVKDGLRVSDYPIKLSKGQEQKFSENVSRFWNSFSDQNLVLDAIVLNKLVDSYLKNMHSLHPFLDVHTLRNSVSRFGQQYSTLHNSQVENSEDNAIVLLVLALGEVLSYEWWDYSDSRPGISYFVLATRILEHKSGINTIARAQAHLLAALYLGQFADTLKSWDHISIACEIVLT